MLTRSEKTHHSLIWALSRHVLTPDRAVLEGLYAAGEAADFGGGGLHGYNALEGAFLGGCIFSGRAAGRALSGQN
ncbi:FAD-binding protein [Brevundimonas diminuta]|uniref:FAD-binding protein n=1 Tax=Brevundimonas diminuta TaxID=293 RepID=UPI0020977874|nr:MULTISPECIES: FAD-binding protein [Brevundimonas]MCO8030023.1 FAD-binding protein [Brevundimonas diminuta]